MTDIDKDWLSSQYARHFSAIELVVGGVNRTYRVHEGASTYYLRLYRKSGRPLPQIAAEISLLTRFRDDAEITVSRPVATRSGAYILQVMWNGEARHACLFESVEGENMAVTPAGMEQFGTALAHLHLAMPTTIDGDVRSLDLVAIGQDVLQALRPIPQSQNVMRVIEHHHLAAWQPSQLRGLSAGLCHGDAWKGNIRMHQGKASFFDFDDFGHGPLVSDLGTAAWHLAHEHSPDTDAMISALVAGYDKVRPLSHAEKEALPLFIEFAEVRSLLFLARYCALTDELWTDTFERAEGIFRRR